MYLLDTHTLIWAVIEPERLPAHVVEILSDIPIKVSVVSYWELVLKKGRQSAPVSDPTSWWDRYVTRSALEVIPVRVAHVDRLNTLPEWHRDPFDRMLIAQALSENCTLITRDEALARYGVPIIWDRPSQTRI